MGLRPTTAQISRSIFVIFSLGSANVARVTRRAGEVHRFRQITLATTASRRARDRIAYMTKLKIDILRICFVLLATSFAGCSKTGPDLAPVSGRITLDGNPLENADIVFQPDGSKPPSSGRANKDGQYQLGYKRGVMGGTVGSNTVRITISSDVVANPPNIPVRYNTESKLTKEVKSGQNEINFDLTTDEK